MKSFSFNGVISRNTFESIYLFSCKNTKKYQKLFDFDGNLYKKLHKNRKNPQMRLLLMTMMFLGEVHAGKNEGGAEDEIEGDLFA